MLVSFVEISINIYYVYYKKNRERYISLISFDKNIINCERFIYQKNIIISTSLSQRYLKNLVYVRINIIS